MILIYGGVFLTLEKSEGTLRRQLTGPVGRSHVLARKVLGRVAIAGVQIVLLLVGRFLFGVSFGHSRRADPLAPWATPSARRPRHVPRCRAQEPGPSASAPGVDHLHGDGRSGRLLVARRGWCPAGSGRLRMCRPHCLGHGHLPLLISFGRGMEAVWLPALVLFGFRPLFSLLGVRFLRRHSPDERGREARPIAVSIRHLGVGHHPPRPPSRRGLGRHASGCASRGRRSSTPRISIERRAVPWWFGPWYVVLWRPSTVTMVFLVLGAALVVAGTRFTKHGLAARRWLERASDASRRSLLLGPGRGPDPLVQHGSDWALEHPARSEANPHREHGCPVDGAGAPAGNPRDRSPDARLTGRARVRGSAQALTSLANATTVSLPRSWQRKLPGRCPMTLVQPSQIIPPATPRARKRTDCGGRRCRGRTWSSRPPAGRRRTSP